MAAPDARLHPPAGLAAAVASWASDQNKLRPEDRAFHDWYRFVLSFPPHLVRRYIERFEVAPGQLVLDPFCGTGTTLVECKKVSIESAGIEANPMPCFATSVKVDWGPEPDSLLNHARRIAERVTEDLGTAGLGEYDFDSLPLFKGQGGQPSDLRTLAPEEMQLLLRDSISPVPLHKVLALRDAIDLAHDGLPFVRHERLALAKTSVFGASNLHFGPEVGVVPPKDDAPVVSTWLAAVAAMAEDLKGVSCGDAAGATVHNDDARDVKQLLEPRSVDVVITSPPYPNEKDYTRTTRLESVILGFFSDKRQLRRLKQSLVRSNTRNVYKGDDDHSFVAGHGKVENIAREIEERRAALGKTSGWERQYAKVVRLYFGGMARHFGELRRLLKPGARLAYVVGDQASFFRVMIRTGELLADIASSLGYEVMGIDLFRTRLATATKEQLREEVVLLRWPGNA